MIVQIVKGPHDKPGTRTVLVDRCVVGRVKRSVTVFEAGWYWQPPITDSPHRIDAPAPGAWRTMAEVRHAVAAAITI